jgi:hypothetical protein
VPSLMPRPRGSFGTGSSVSRVESGTSKS